MLTVYLTDLMRTGRLSNADVSKTKRTSDLKQVLLSQFDHTAFPHKLQQCKDGKNSQVIRFNSLAIISL